MRLQELIQGIATNPAHSPDVNIRGVHFHSAKIRRGDLFVAIQGHAADGHEFIPAAVEAGAVAVIGEKEIAGCPVPYVRVPDSRRALGVLAGRLSGHPSRRHRMVGITGTNGKTTTAYLLRHILEEAGVGCSLFGTVSCILNGEEAPSSLTTPNALDLQRMLAESRDPAVVMEVSSHAIDQERIAGISFDIAAFTNLSREHMDYHGDIHRYFETKAALFSRFKEHGIAVVGTWDHWGRRLSRMLGERGVPVFTFGEGESDDLRLLEQSGEWPPRCLLCEEERTFWWSLPLPGLYNVRNGMAAYLIARRMGIDADTILTALAVFPGVPGRFETYRHPSGARFIVDYAHTPDGFRQFLHTVRSGTARRLTHIFGFRGDRDPTKREEMVEVSARYSDRILLTLDDLGDVPPEDMLAELRSLAERCGNASCSVVEDRTRAIEAAWRESEPGDTVVITGKGTDPYRQSFALSAGSDPETLHRLGARREEPEGGAGGDGESRACRSGSGPSGAWT